MGGFRPHKRGGLGIAVDHVGVNRGNEFRDAPEHPAPKLFGREVAKDTLHQIEPRATGRDEVHVDAWVPGQPPLDRGVFVGGIVVGDQMQGLVLRNLPINQP